MLNNLMHYKDYWAVVELDDSADQFHGRVIGINDVVDFYGGTPEELRREFAASVEEYVAWCREEGTEPEKSWSGKMTLRPSDEQHRRFLLAAAASRKSVHGWMLEVLDRESRRIVAEVPDTAPRSAA
ncbi:MAG TPA: type II toxin-antitoxin system HicB family antitoxin [Geminicoccaceae bacterium]|nr:type II toxin-antitoxin system HicB family antitoxin [Geminicoccaceae bacterium]